MERPANIDDYYKVLTNYAKVAIEDWARDQQMAQQKATKKAALKQKQKKKRQKKSPTPHTPK